MWPFRGAQQSSSVLGGAREAIRALQDVGRQATIRGVETLGKLTQKGVEVASPGVALTPVAGASALLAKHAGAAVIATMKLEKDVNGWGFLLLDRPDALRLVDMLLQRPAGATTQFSALEESAVAETANIALNQMVTVFAKTAGLSIRTTAPETSSDVRGRLAAAHKPWAGEDHVVLVETGFVEKGANVKGTMVLAFFVKPAEK